MTAEVIRDILAWSTVINLGILLIWALLLIVAHDWVYRLHSIFCKIPVEKFNTANYKGIMFFKLGIFLFNLGPYLAMRIVV